MEYLLGPDSFPTPNNWQICKGGVSVVGPPDEITVQYDRDADDIHSAYDVWSLSKMT